MSEQYPERRMDEQPTVTQSVGAAANGKTLPSPGKGEGSENAATTSPEEEAFDAPQALILLLVGAVLEGNDALLARLRRWQATTTDPDQRRTENSSPSNLGHSLLGLLIRSPAALRRQWLLADRLSKILFGLAEVPLKPVVGSRLFRPARRRFDALVGEGESLIAAWAATAKTEEPRARAMAQLATNDLIDEIVRHLSENPELAKMIQTQSVGLADEVTDNIRSRTVTADITVERLVRSLLRRQPRLETEAEATITGL